MQHRIELSTLLLIAVRSKPKTKKVSNIKAKQTATELCNNIVVDETGHLVTEFIEAYEMA